MKKLNDEQRKLVSKNHNMIYDFMRKHKLNEEDYYDVCAIGFCRAAAGYDEKRGKFSTLAYKSMENAVKRHHEKIDRNTLEKNMISINFTVDDNKESKVLDLSDISNDCIMKNFENKIIFRLHFQDTMSKLTSQEKIIVTRLMNDESHQKIADEIGLTRQRVSQIVKDKIRPKFKNFYK